MSWAARRAADAEAFKTLVPVRSTWTISGDAQHDGAIRSVNAYHCSACGGRGHSVRTCGRR